MSKIDFAHYGPGRPMKPETVAILKKMMARIEKDPGIQNGRLAKDLGLTSLRSVQLARRLEAKGAIKIEQQDDRSLVFTPTAD